MAFSKLELMFMNMKSMSLMVLLKKLLKHSKRDR